MGQIKLPGMSSVWNVSVLLTFRDMINALKCGDDLFWRMSMAKKGRKTICLLKQLEKELNLLTSIRDDWEVHHSKNYNTWLVCYAAVVYYMVAFYLLPFTEKMS